MKLPKVLIIIGIVSQMQIDHSLFAQSSQQPQMEKLNFLIGEWVGTSKIFKDGQIIKEGAANEKISYDLDGSTLIIELNTEFLQLHTVIQYNEIDQKYYYNRFSKDGAAVYPAEYVDGQLIVWKDDTTRFFFTSTADGDFIEYGESLIDGVWIKTFEDSFTNTQ